MRATRPVSLPTSGRERAVGLFLDPQLDLQDDVVELHHGQALLVADARLPAVKEALLGKERAEVLDSSAEDRQKRRPASTQEWLRAL